MTYCYMKNQFTCFNVVTHSLVMVRSLSFTTLQVTCHMHHSFMHVTTCHEHGDAYNDIPCMWCHGMNFNVNLKLVFMVLTCRKHVFFPYFLACSLVLMLFKAFMVGRLMKHHKNQHDYWVVLVHNISVDIKLCTSS